MSLEDRIKKLKQEESTSSLSASQNLSLADRLIKLDKSSEGIKAPKTNGLNYNLSAYDDEDYQKKYDGASYEDVQRGLLKSTSNRERNYLKNYSDWSSTKDFDKAIANADTTKVKPKINADDSLWTKATKTLSRGTSEADILKSKKKAFQRANPLEKYSDIMSNTDFEEKSKYNPNAVAEYADENFHKRSTGKRMLSLYRQINTGEKPSSFDMFYDTMTSSRASVEGAMLNNYKYNVDQMTDDEKKVYNYIYNTQGGEAAFEFVKDISYATSKRSYEEWSEITKDMVNNSGPLANLALEGIAAAGKMIMAPQLIANVAESALDYDNYNSYEGFGGVNFVLSDVAPNIAQKYAEKYPDANINIPLMGEINAPKTASESITSDIEARVGQSLLGPAYTISMGMNSYLQSIRDAQEKGLPASQAVATAMIAGGVEIVTESFGFENFLNLTKNPAGKQVALNVLKGVFNEGSEEVAADVLNTIADLTINGAQSEINQNVEAYKKAGMSDSDAWAKAKSDFSAQVAESFIAGGLSGGASTAVTNIINRANYSQLGENVDATRLKNAAEQAKASAEANGTTSDAYDYYAKLANKYGEDLSKKGSDKNAMTGYLLDQLVNEASSNYEEGAIEQFLIENGYSADVSRETAKAIKAVNPTKEQEKVLKGKAAKEALAALRNGVAVNKANDKMVQAVADSRAAQNVLKTRTERNIESNYKVGTAGTAEVVGTADNGKIRVIENGQEKTVDKKAVTVTKNTALALEYSKNLNENAQKAIIENMPASVEDVQQYVSDAYHAFTYGQEFTTDDNGVEVSGIEAMKQDIKDGMLTTDIDTLTKLYEAGAQVKNQQKQQVAVLEQADQAVASAYQGGKQGSFKTDGNINVRTLSPSERALYYMAKTFTLRGQNVVVFKDASDKSENGKFVAGPNGGTVYINLAARYAVNGDRFDRSYVVSAFAHETTHWMKANAQEDFKVFADHIRNAIGQKQFDSLVVTEMNRYKQSTGNTLSEADAREEVIARACEDMLNNPDTYADIMSKATPEEQSNLKRIIMKAIDAVMDFLNTMLKNYRSNAEAARYLRRNIDEYEKLRQEWIAVFDKASTNVQAMLDKAVDQAIEPTEDIKVHNNDKVNMSATVEGVAGKLMAYHNLSEENLLNTIELGGFPMPSIAIKLAGVGHNEFGKISVIFNKNTINPGSNRANGIFGGDAWTATFPDVDLKINNKKRIEIQNKVMGIVGEEAYNKLGGANLDTSNMEDIVNRYKDPVIGYENNKTLQYAFLKDSGKGFEIPMRDKRLNRDLSNESIGAIAKVIGENQINEAYENGYKYQEEHPEFADLLRLLANEASLREYDAQVANSKAKDDAKLREVYATLFDNNDGKLDFSDYDRLLHSMRRSLYDNEKEIDSAAFESMLKENIETDEFKTWLGKLFDGIVEKKGIRNNVDYFTPSGNRRSWDALHYELTLENVVKVMSKSSEQGANGFFEGQNIWGVATKKYKSITEMREDISRLALANEETVSKLRSEYTDRLSNITNDIMYKGKGSNYFVEYDNAAGAIVDSLRGAKTVETIDRNLREYSYLNIKDHTAQDIYDVYKDILEMPTDYFEAKPKRAVGLNEIAYVVIPTYSTDKLKKALTDNGIRYVEYEHSDDNFDDRIKVTNEEAVRQQAEGSQVLFNSKVDSDGNELSAGQVEYFKDSKIRDANGNLLVVYHGTPDKSFNVFRGNEIYFTANKAYAQNYTHTYATGGKIVNNDNPGMFMGYLNIRKPFDINDSEVRNIFINEYVKGGYSQSLHPLTPIAEINRIIDRDGISWEEGGNLQEFLEESEYSYDGMVLNEGGYMTDKGPVSRGVSYVAFNSNQFKNIDNLNPTDNEDVRYNKKIDERGNVGIVEWGDAYDYFTPRVKKLIEKKVFADVTKKRREVGSLIFKGSVEISDDFDVVYESFEDNNVLIDKIIEYDKTINNNILEVKNGVHEESERNDSITAEIQNADADNKVRNSRNEYGNQIEEDDSVFAFGKTVRARYSVGNRQHKLTAKERIEAARKSILDSVDENGYRKDEAVESSDVNTKFSLRVEEPPKKTIKAYKVFVAFRNEPGKLYPPMVSSPGGADTPVGVWLNADTGELARNKDGSLVVNTRGRIKVASGGKGTNASKGTLAYRPGWHLGEYPDAKQFAVNDENGNKTLFPENFIFAECEIAADEDYQIEAMEYGMNSKGKFDRTQAGLPYIPENGYYKYRTNPNPETAPWYITGAMKVTQILNDDEVAKICAQYGVKPLERKGGKINLSDYGFTAGKVTPTQDLSNVSKRVDYSEEVKKLPGYTRRKLNFADPNIINEFAINNLDASKYSEGYDTKYNEKVDGYTSVSDTKLAFTDERIDTLLGGGYYGSTNPNYAQAYIAYISPDDYLKLTTGYGQRALERVSKWDTESNSEFSAEKFADNYNSVPIQLNIEEENNEVIGHEGRHRMAVLKKAGVKQVPVLIFNYDNKYSKEHIDSISLMPQWFQSLDDAFTDADRITLTDLVPFSNGNKEEIKQKFGSGQENAVHFNEKVNTEAYEILEENKRFEKENAKLKKDMARLRKLLRLQGKVTDGKVLDDHQLEVVAGVLLKDGRSNYSKDKLVEDLRDVYTFALDVFQSGPEAYDELMARLYDVAAKIMNNSRPVKVTNDYYKMVLDDIRKSRIRLSDEQIQEAKNEYGDRYRDAYWGRMTLANDGMPIESLWQEWADAYPDIFKADVNPNDMILELSEIYDSLKDASELKQYYTDTESIRSMANEVYEKFWNIKPIVTVADKYNEEIKKINAEHRQEMAELKESMQNQKLADRMYYSRVINKLKEQNAEKIRALKEYQRNKAEKYKDAARRKMAIEKITAQSTKLMSWMTENSRKHHINDALKVPVMNMLDAINFSSKQLLGMYGSDEKKFTPTRKDVSLAKAMQEIRVLVTNVVNAQGDDSKDVNVGGFLYLPPQMVEEITQLTDQLNDIERDLGRQNQYVLQEMTIEELESLQDIVDKMYHCVTKMNQLMADRGKALVAVPSQDTIRECGEQAVREKANKLTKAEDFMTFKNGVPYYVFERLGKGASHILNNVFTGWGQFAFNIQKIVDFADRAYTQAEVKAWTKEVHDITVWQSPTEEEKANGIESTERQIKMTTAQMMSLYCLSKREQARQHMFGGGIRIADFKQDMNEILQTDAVTLTESEIDRIIGMLTDRQREVADEIQQFMNTTCSAWGNDVTLQMYGTREFLEENYFPIKSDANVLRADVRDDAKSIYALLNMSFTKGLVKNANNQIVVDDIFNVFAVHSSDMAKYNALALPVLDMIKWWNYSESVKREGTNFDKITVKGAIEKAYGKEANSYIRHLLEDINGSQETGRYDDITSKWFKGYKVAAVGFNMQTVLLQPLSYIRANNVMDTKYLLAGLVGKPMTEKAKKYSGLAVWKSLGYYDTNVSFGLDKMITHNYNAKEIIADKSLELAGKADELTWGCLWRACEAEILSTRNLVYDTEEFNQAVAERFNEVIVSTQVMDSTVTRSDLMRSNATHVKEFTAFMSEPTLSLNVLQSNVIKFADETRKSNVHTAMQKYGRKIGKACAVYAFSALAESILRGVIGKLRDADWDEEDEETIMSRIWDNFLSELNIFNKIPVISNIVEMLKGFSTQSMAFTGLDNTIKAFKKLLKSFEDGLTYKDVYKMIRGLSELKGIPLGNLVRTLKTVYDNTIGLMFKFGND